MSSFGDIRRKHCCVAENAPSQGSDSEFLDYQFPKRNGEIGSALSVKCQRQIELSGQSAKLCRLQLEFSSINARQFIDN